ncbi:retinol dehydrogenase 8-like [Xenia sp. Carnegie-2017]|uniref:retinol dehydrogenase 8-like n=1 Tax=Xenia sp. Carnegie-2017 TaxID=2897299 RepID=UPI001F040DF9|nr:retinol dehydrogenase 8-like [Xenia sp. Carnegie-2017]
MTSFVIKTKKAATSHDIIVKVNNAAIGWCGVLEVQAWESITSIYETNVYGVLRVIRAVVPSMKKNKKGRIVNISSIAGIYCSPFFTVYGSSKYALEGISDSLVPELASFNVQVRRNARTGIERETMNKKSKEEWKEERTAGQGRKKQEQGSRGTKEADA